MTHTNEGHLNCHRKKQKMMLNLGLAKTAEVPDQTPTPTRLIRNCEELGLFQDLQNVNPFDEVFKKAAEATKSDTILEIPPQQNCDDSLHTPHILPRKEIEETVIKNEAKPNEGSNSNEFLLTIPVETENNNRDLMVDRLKQRVRQVLQTKGRRKQRIPSVALLPVGKIGLDDPREKIKEMNRAAQMRCRKRKQEKILQMEAELSALRESNKRLRIKNYLLNIENEHLRKIVTDHKTELGPSASSDVPTQCLKKEQNKDKGPIVVQVVPVPFPFTSVKMAEKANHHEKMERRLVQIIPNKCLNIPIKN